MAHERLAGERLALRDLALVVREDQVGAAAVQVERRAELLHRHRRALDVPAGPADAERRAPRGLVGERRLPEHEVERVAPVRIVGVAAAGPGEPHHLVVASSATACRSRRNVETSKYAVPCGEVRVAGVEQALDDRRRSRRSSRSRAARRSAAACRARPCRAWKRAISASASSRYGTPSSRAFGRIESSTSVMLRTMRTSWPRSSSRRMRRS